MLNEDKIVIRFLKEQLKELKAERKQCLKDQYYGYVDTIDHIIHFVDKHIFILEMTMEAPLDFKGSKFLLFL